MNGRHGTLCWHIVGLQYHVDRGPQVAGTYRIPTVDIVHAVHTTPTSWELRDPGWSSPRVSCRHLKRRRGGRGWEGRGALHCSHLRRGPDRGRASRRPGRRRLTAARGGAVGRAADPAVERGSGRARS